MTTTTQVTGFAYLKSFPGILKIAEEVANFIGIICIAIGGTSPRGDAFIACSLIALIVTGLLLLCYMTPIATKIKIPWYKIELFFYVPWILFYIAVSAFALAWRYDPYTAGAVFGFIATLCYIVDALHKCTLLRTS